MAKLALNKSTLNKEGKKLESYRQFVPALDLKRKQLMAARADVTRELKQKQQAQDDLEQAISTDFSMLAGSDIRLEELVTIKRLEIGEYNLVGLDLPVLSELELSVRQYSRLASPYWLDQVIELLQQSVRFRLEARILEQRLELLNEGLQKTTQRLNLFDKVLIPQSEKNIRKIRIALSDAERAGVVRAKIAKNKRRSQGQQPMQVLS